MTVAAFLAITSGVTTGLFALCTLRFVMTMIALISSNEVRSEVERLDMRWQQTSWRPVLPLVISLRQSFASMEDRPIGSSIRARLAMLGNPLQLLAADFLAINAMTALSLTGVGIGFGLLMPLLGLSILAVIPFAVIGVCAGTFFPLYYLYSESGRRTQRIERDLPYALDLIVLMMDAGASLNAAIRNLGTSNRHGPLGEELALADREMGMGTIFTDAITAMAERVQSEDLTVVVHAIEQGQRLGTPMSDILREQADLLRLKRTQRAEKLAKQASSKMIFPLLMIMAATFLLVLGPAALRFKELMF